MYGLMMPTQSNAHDSDDAEIFSDTSDNDGEVAEDQWVAIIRNVIYYYFS